MEMEFTNGWMVLHTMDLGLKGRSRGKECISIMMEGFTKEVGRKI